MPMFEPSKRDGYVLDLDTAVKDGVLGCVAGDPAVAVAGVVSDAVAEKLDLQKMISELNLAEIPSVFICPISLEPMRDPVTLCTGQTYERSNILTWLGLGHVTCPTTMQELWDDSLTPNRTLHHLIHTWFSQKYLLMKKRSEDVHGRASEMVDALRRAKGRARVQALKDLRRAVAAHATARRAVIDAGGVGAISALLGPFTSHAVGCEAIGILVELELDSEAREGLMQPAKMSLVADILNEGSVETKIGCARLIAALVREEDEDFDAGLVASHSLLAGLMRLVRDRRSGDAALPGLRLLKAVCSREEVRGLVVRIGAVSQLVELLPGLDPECVELALSVLDALSALPSGRAALKDCPSTIPNMVRLLMRVSEGCTQLALSVLWCVCRLAPEECSAAAVEAGLAAKLLLVIQSGCGPVLKQRSAELLKLCSLNYTDTLFISKCKLTRTIQ